MRSSAGFCATASGACTALATRWWLSSNVACRRSASGWTCGAWWRRRPAWQVGAVREDAAEQRPADLVFELLAELDPDRAAPLLRRGVAGAGDVGGERDADGGDRRHLGGRDRDRQAQLQPVVGVLRGGRRRRG